MARIPLIVAGLGLFYAVLLGRLSYLQVWEGVSAQTVGELSARRGSIYVSGFQGGATPVAATKPFPAVYIVPKELEDVPEAVNTLSDILGIASGELEERLGRPGDAYKLLQRKADAVTVERVRDARLRGVNIDDVPERFYPYGSLMAHALGFVGPSREGPAFVGHYGLEEYYEPLLAEGGDVTLTVDPEIQAEAERILGQLIASWDSPGGSVIVMDPRTGMVLAMASAPDFDPNAYSSSPLQRFINPAVQHVYEPGSIVKVLTMAAGIDAGAITPETAYDDTGSVTVSGKTISNWDKKAHGRVTMTNVIEQSINTGAVFAERQTGHAAFRSYLESFGLGGSTGIDLPGEQKGDLRQLTPRAPQIAYATAAFGQGIAVTPIGLASAIGAIANGGTLMRPYLNAERGPSEVRRVLKPETARAVRDMMVSAVDKAGVAAVKGYSLAGKTGTAFIPDFNNGGYTDHVINTYAGFGPVSDPRFVILIKLDDPAGAPVAALTVVPAFRELAQYFLNHYRIPPDRL